MRDRTLRGARALLCLASFLGGACDVGPDEAAGGGEAAQGGGRDASGASRDAFVDDAFVDDLQLEGPRDLALRRGLGSVTARVPGTTEVISGVRVSSHRARVTIEDGFSRTEIEEELENGTDRTLEGRYVFPIPPGATVTRLGLWVGTNLVEGEIVDRRRAAEIFRSIVEDTVRPRDPALLEWVRGGEVSLKIFPIPARGSRKVVLAYDEALPTVAGKTRYTLPLSLGADRATSIHDFRIQARVVSDADDAPVVTTPGWDTSLEDGSQASFTATDFTPVRDFVLDVAARRPPAAGRVVVSAPETHDGAERRFFSTSITPAFEAAPRARDRVIVLDTSDGQSAETLDAEVRTTRAIVASLAPEERWAVLACASRCTSFPARGLASAGADVGALDAYLTSLKPGGASDLAGAIARGATRLERGGQVVALHDGKSTAGELSPSSIGDRVLPVLSVQGAELRLIGVGRSLDDVVLEGVARATSSSYEPLAGGASLAARTRRLIHDLARPVLVDVRVELPPGFDHVVPSTWASVSPGTPLRLYGTLDDGAAGVAHVVGVLDGESIAMDLPLAVDAEGGTNPLLSKLWADRAIAELEADGGAEAKARVVALSKAYHVLSRQTSLLVLENERMFSEFGVQRTTRVAGDQVDHGFGGLDVAPEAPAAASPWDAGEGAVGAPAAGSGQGFGAGAGRLAGSHRTKPPQVRMGSTVVSGRVPPEVIQRIVRQNFGRFRACYEMGLHKNPDLGGRVVTQFVIGRSGQVTHSADAGSDLPDPQVVACVVHHFRALAFPEPDGDIVRVTYPIVFASDGTRPTRPTTLWPEPDTRLRPDPPRPPPPPPPRRPEPRFKMIVEHQPGSDAWRKAGDAELSRLEKEVAATPGSRQKRARYVQALLGRGRWESARDEAQRFAELDPDLAAARELLAQSAAAVGDRERALEALEALVEADPRRVDGHLRAARALEASGDVERACAHRRSLAELEPTPAGSALASACWDVVVGGAEASAHVADARAALPKDPPSSFAATVACDDAAVACPDVAIITPAGRVVSRAAPWQATPIPGGIALLGASTGGYRTVLFGGDPSARGKVTVRAYGTTREVAFGADTARTALVTSVDQEWLPHVRW